MLLPGPSVSSRPGFPPAQLAATTAENSLWLKEQAKQVEKGGEGRLCEKRNRMKRAKEYTAGEDDVVRNSSYVELRPFPFSPKSTAFLGGRGHLETATSTCYLQHL
jgi:hypothetical protein